MLAIVFMVIPAAAASTCSDGDGWTKIDSGDLSQYPVNGADGYCFKAGPYTASSIPAGGFGQEGSCNDGVQYCDLSHWSYHVGVQPTGTSVPTNTPPPSTLTETPTSTQEPTNTPGPTRTPRATSTPESTRTPPPGSTPTYTATPGRTSTGTPTSTPGTTTPSPDPRIPCPCIYETIIIQGKGGEADHTAFWAAITLLVGTNAVLMIKRRKLEK